MGRFAPPTHLLRHGGHVLRPFPCRARRYDMQRGPAEHGLAARGGFGRLHLDSQRLPAGGDDAPASVCLDGRAVGLQAGLRARHSGVHVRFAAVRALAVVRHACHCPRGAGSRGSDDDERKHVDGQAHLPQAPPGRGGWAQRHRRGHSLGGRAYALGRHPGRGAMAVAVCHQRAGGHTYVCHGPQASARQPRARGRQDVQLARGRAQRRHVRTVHRLRRGILSRRRAAHCAAGGSGHGGRGLCLRAHAGRQEVPHAAARPAQDTHLHHLGGHERHLVHRPDARHGGHAVHACHHFRLQCRGHRTAHDVVAAGHHLRGAAGGMARGPRTSGYTRRHRPVYAQRGVLPAVVHTGRHRPLRACLEAHAVRCRLRVLPVAKQPSAAKLGPAAARRQRQRHAGHGPPDRPDARRGPRGHALPSVRPHGAPRRHAPGGLPYGVRGGVLVPEAEGTDGRVSGSQGPDR